MANDDVPAGSADPAEPGTPGNPQTLTDPRMMRALAHPARIAILQRLALEGPATATECAEVAGLSPSACSYHLRALARYGFVEEDPAAAVDGRQRPWRARIIAFSIESGPGVSTASRVAGNVLRQSLQERFGEVREAYFAREALYPAGWQENAGTDRDVLHVTAEEFATLRARLRDLMSEYRRLDPAQRPAGARRVQAEIDLIPWFDPEARR